MMKKAIVTGATGFIGRWLVRELLRENISVTAVIRPDSPNRRFLPENDELQVAECRMDSYHTLPEQISRQKECVFYHLAWAGVSGSDRIDLKVQLDNVYASGEAVKAASAIGCDAFIGLGSIMEEEAAAVTDGDKIKPGLGYIYGEAKQFSHLLTKALAVEYHIAHMWPVLTNAYGEYESSPRFINTTLRKIIYHEPLEFTAGTQMYDFIHVKDAVRALIAIGRRGGAFQRYLVGSGYAAPLRTFIERIGKTLAPQSNLNFGKVPFTGVSLPIERFDIDALIKDTGFVPQIPFEDGIRRTMDWIEKSERMKPAGKEMEVKLKYE